MQVLWKMGIYSKKNHFIYWISSYDKLNALQCLILFMSDSEPILIINLIYKSFHHLYILF